MLRGIDRRLTELEQRIAPPEKHLIYREDPRGGGLFCRGGDTSGRLMTKSEVCADVAAAGATIIFVEYESLGMTTGEGTLAGPDLHFGEGTTALFLPNNHRSELERAT